VPVERLQKILAEAGVASRRGSEALIAAGRVTVDGQVATVGDQLDPAGATIAVDGRTVEIGHRPRAYLALHKPSGVTSTVRDRHADRTVVDLIPRDLSGRVGRLYPVGRLDLESEGLILLTNDGDWANRVLHPSHRVEREYAVGLRMPLRSDQERALRDGIALDEGLAVVTQLRATTAVETRRMTALLDPAPGPLVWYRATLEQGWKRQLRRMFAAIGTPIERLVRVRVGTIRLDGLRSGECRVISAAEAATVTGAARRRR
jgi:23S rRNA pseudouridine2605 synthase